MTSSTSNTRLTKEQKEAVGLLSIGTFLEYFDLMLYVHMAVLLNELFFPKTDPHTASLLAAFTFCITFVFRPFGAMVIGYIGDTIGRKPTVIITTFMMALSCLIMANLPTYAQVGIIASWVMVSCRVLQGVSSICEIIGVELYITETIESSLKCSMVALIGVFSALGGTAALGIVSLVNAVGLNWRMAFWVGTIIALVGTVARLTLRETPEFADAKRRLGNTIRLSRSDQKLEQVDFSFDQKVNKRTTLSLFAMDCCWPVCFYIGYIHCSTILSNSFGYTGDQIIAHNFFVSITELFALIALVYFGRRIYPLKILRVLGVLFLIFTLICPYLLYASKTPFTLMIVQSIIVGFGPTIMIAVPILFKRFPVFKRFTYVSVIHAVSRAFIYVITAFGLIFLVDQFGHWGLLVVMLPASVGFLLGLSHFENMDARST